MKPTLEDSSTDVSGAEEGPESSLDYDLDISANKNLKDKIRSRILSNDKFFSLEFFPPRTKEGAVNLIARYVNHSKVFIF